MEHDLSIGDRIRYYRRRRGMSQRVLGELVGRSESWVSQVERGQLPVDRISVVAEVARALRIEFGQLLGQPVIIGNGSHGGIPAIRRALTAAILRPPAEEPVDLEALRADVAKGWRARQAARYSAVAAVLPDLIHRAEAAVRTANGNVRERWAVASSVYQLAAAVLCRPGETDLAWIAADRAMRTAEVSENPLLVGTAAWRLAHVFRATGRYDEGTDVVVRAAEALGSPGTPAQLCVWGALHLFGGVIRACDSDPGEAWRMQRVAAEAAEQLGEDRNDYWTTFGPTNVAIHDVAVQVELGQPGEALRAAEHVDTSPLPTGWTARRARHWIDVAQSHWQRRDDAAAVNVMLEAERIAAEEVRYQAVVRAMLVDFLRRERKGAAPGLRPLAQRVGVLD